MTNSFTYSGSVCISTNKSEKKFIFKNSGTVKLFECIYNVLSQAVSSIDKVTFNRSLPNFIGIVDMKGQSPDLSITNYFDPLYGNKVCNALSIYERNVDSAGILSFKTTVSHSDLNTAFKGSETTSYHAFLLDGNMNILAVSTVAADTFQVVWDDITGQAIVEWRMRFQNNSSEVQNL